MSDPFFRLSFRILLAAAAFVARGEVIDRVAVSVGNQVITTSDLDREIRVTAFLDGRQPDFSPPAKRATADRMVEQTLIRHELVNSRYPVPTSAEAEPDYRKLVRERFQDDAALRAALAAAGVSAEDVKGELLWLRTLMLFIEVRFQPGVQLGDEEIEEYFERFVKPAEEKARPGAPIAVEPFRAQIEKALTEAEVSRQLDAWLKNARDRTVIAYHEEALQ